MNRFAVLQSELVAVRRWLGSQYLTLIRRQRSLLVEPVAVLYEIHKWHGICQVMVPVRPLVDVQGQAILRVGDMRARPGRA